MTQTQLVQTLADNGEVTKKIAKTILDTLAQTAITEVKENGVFVFPASADWSVLTARHGWGGTRRR